MKETHVNVMTETIFQIGDLVTPNSLYPRGTLQRRREGRITHIKGSIVTVRWNDLATPERLAQQFLKTLPRLTRRRRLDEIDAAATALYDKLNPNWLREINISKYECIRRVMFQR